MEAGRMWQLLLLSCLASFACCAELHDSHLTTCLRTCEIDGCVGKSCLSSCSYLYNTAANNASHQSLVSPALLQKWQEWVCKTECDYHCTLLKESEEAGFTQEATGFRDDWCLARSVHHHDESRKLYVHLLKTGFTRGINIADINEPLSAAFSALNILANLIGIISILRNSLQKRPNERSPYPYTDLWTGFGLMSILYWLSRYILHSREMVIDKHFETSLEISLYLYCLCLAIMRIGNMRTEAARVIVAAPTIAFLYTHLMYMNLCVYDYGLNIQLCLGLAFTQYLLWISWAAKNRHPGRYLLLLGALNASLVVFLRVGDFGSKPTLTGETEALWIASTIPLTVIWWSFALLDTRDHTAHSRGRKATSISDSKKDR